MFSVQAALRGFVVAGTLLVASATQANDVTSDRHQASSQVKEPPTAQEATAAEREGVDPKKGSVHPCTCRRATPKAQPSSPEQEAELDRLRSQPG